MKIAFIYAGQGSQVAGMGLDLYEGNEVFKKSMDELDATGRIKELCFNTEISELSKTDNTQPAMVGFAIAVTEVLMSMGIKPAYAAGLSLGEYSALYAAGVFSKTQAIDLVSFRGKQMATVCANIDCGMAAILGLDRDVLQEVCNKAEELGIITIANYNCPGQLIISGEKAALEEACELAKVAGARRVMPLNVSGAFHSKLMKPAGDALREKFKKEAFGEMKIPVIFNATARPINVNDNIPTLLERQVQDSVYFEDSIYYSLVGNAGSSLQVL